MKKGIMLGVLISGAIFTDCVCQIRLGKKDREDMIYLVAEPMKKIEQKIDSINQAANQIQNFIVDNYNQAADQELKNQYQEILNKVSHMGILLEALAYVIQSQIQYIQELNGYVGDLTDTVANFESHLVTLESMVADIKATVGSRSDLSTGQEEFDSVDDIDEAQLSLVSLAKTEYREQLHDKFIS